MRKIFFVIIVLFLSGCTSNKEVGKISISVREKSKTIEINKNSSFYFTDASLIRNDTTKQDYKDFITDGNDIVIAVKFDYNTAILRSTDSQQFYTTFIEIKNFIGNNYNIELDTSSSVVYTRYQTYLQKKYYSNPIGRINITKNGNDSLLVKMNLKYKDELELQGEFIALRDKEKLKFLQWE